MADTADIVIIGGGSTGTSLAWQLARRGAGRVVLLEREAIAAGGTGWSSGIVRQHYTHPVLARMALQALRFFERFEELVGGDAAFRRVGYLFLVQPLDADKLAANVAMHRAAGIDTRYLTPAEAGELEPRMALDGIGAAAWEPGSGYADPVSTAAAFAAAARRHGAEVRIGPRVERIVAGPHGVERIETTAGAISTRTVVVAAGYRTRELVAPLGVDLSITPIRHDIAIIQRTTGFGARHAVIADLVHGSYLRPEGDALTLVGMAGAYEGPEDREVEATREPTTEATTELVRLFCRRFPGQEDATLRRGYTGIYDCTPDLQPYLGPIPGVPGLHVAAGFSGHGFKLSPVVGEMLATRILDGGESNPDLDLFSPNRFYEGRPVRAPHAYAAPMLG